MHVIRYQITDVKLKTVMPFACAFPQVVSIPQFLNPVKLSPFQYIVGAIVTASYNILYSLVSYTTSKYEVNYLKVRSHGAL